MKRINRVVVLVLSAHFAVSGCAARMARMTDTAKSERLAVERGRLSQFTDPVAKVRSYIIISDILIDFASGMASDGNMIEMKGLLLQYTTTIQEARDTIVKADRNPEKSPAGFKDLEMALRSQVRRLQDLAGTLTLDDREPVTAAVEAATKVREGLLRLLFPKGVPSISSVQKT